MRREDVDDGLRDLAFEFFFRFSRFESALKEQGCLRWTNPGDRASPGWMKFVADHREAYRPTPAALALLEAAPMIQVVGGPDGLTFVLEPMAADASTLRRVVDHCLTVRNNLFHGGKHGGGGWDQPKRMQLLLASVIAVLDDLAECAGFSGDYSGYY
ncbi:MAG: hypothetical protein V4472_17515 [Pseudomonadota bacterium]